MTTIAFKTRRLARYFIPMLTVFLMLNACDDWNDIESKFEPPQFNVGEEKDEAYYENLRAFKSTMFNRRLSWGWYSGWAAEGPYMVNALAGVADSLDIVALWGGNWKKMTPSMEKDLKYVQNVKGTKVITTHLMGGFNWTDYLPEDVKDEDWEQWYGWEGELMPEGDWTVPTKKQEEAIRKYARLFGQEILDAGLDGVDFDWEGRDTRGSLASYQERIWVFIDELSKMMGPKSGTGKLLIFDGHSNTINPKVAPYFDLFVYQAYRATTIAQLNSYFAGTAKNFAEYLTPEELIKKFLVTVNYENGMYQTGGQANASLEDGTKVNSLKMMALWKPKYEGVTYPRNGGTGVFHIEAEYAVSATNGYKGFYPWIREAIQLMNPAGVE